MKLQKFFFPVAGLLILLLLVGNMSGIFGVLADNLEEEARFSHQIDADWPCATAEPTDDMAAMLFYSPEKEDFTFSIYVNRPGLSFGWFFRGGGSITEVEEQIAEFAVENINSRAYASMNAQRIARVEFGNDTSIFLDPDKPFTLVVPPEWGSVQFYTEDGKWIDPVSWRL